MRTTAEPGSFSFDTCTHLGTPNSLPSSLPGTKQDETKDQH